MAGFIIDHATWQIKVDSKEKFLKAEMPTNKAALLHWIGLLEVFHRFIPNMNKITEPNIAIKNAGLLNLKGFIPADFITKISLSF